MQSLVELTQEESENIVVNHNEDLEFAQKIDEFLNNNNCNTQPLRVGHTPFSLIICGANANLEVGISPETIIKCMSNSDDHYHGHELTKELIASLPQSIRDPIMIFKGSHNNSLLLVTELKDKYNKEIVVPIELNSRKARTFINRITSAYGKKNIENYIFNQLQQQNLLAINKEKANKLIQSLGLRLPPEESFICYDNSIAYSMKNVKYPIEKKEEITLNEQEMMAQIEAKLRREFEAKFQKMEQKFASLEDQVQTINKFMAAMTEAQDLSKTMAEIESVTKQITECDKVAFYCYDRFTDKFFAQGNDYREWQEGQAAETLKTAFDDKRIMSEGDKTIIPIVSSDGGALGVITAEKENGLSEKEIEFFKPNSQIVNTIELALKKEFEHQGRITDELTHLKNKQGLNEYAADTICGRINDNLPVNIVMCDIDHFKSVNDTYGHDAGDTVLRDVAAILQEGTRTGSDCAFRFGGEEMILILNCEPEKAYEIAERLRISVENSEHTVTAADGQEKNISVTISISCVDNDCAGQKFNDKILKEKMQDSLSMAGGSDIDKRSFTDRDPPIEYIIADITGKQCGFFLSANDFMDAKNSKAEIAQSSFIWANRSNFRVNRECAEAGVKDFNDLLKLTKSGNFAQEVQKVTVWSEKAQEKAQMRSQERSAAISK